MPISKKNKKRDVEKVTAPKDTSKDPSINFIEEMRKSGMMGDIKRKIDFVPTGSWVLNRLIGDGTHTDSPGGFPRGYITELYGDESCGKTTIALQACREAILAGGSAVYADFEHSLRQQKTYIDNMGIPIDDPYKFLHIRPSNFQDGAKAIGKAIMTMKPHIIVIDSVTAMIPKETYEEDADKTIALGMHARLTGTFLNWINKRLEDYNVALVLVNQLRSAIKGQYDTGPREVTSGGRAPRFFASLRINMHVKAKEAISVQNVITGIKENKFVNQVVKVTIEKNKLDLPWKSGPIYITFGKGINNILSLLELAINKRVIKKKGAWFEYIDPDGRSEFNFNINGKAGVEKHLTDHPEILEAIKPRLIITQNVEDMMEIKAELESKDFNSLTDEEKETLEELRKNLGDESSSCDNLNEKEMQDLEELEKITEL